MSEIAGSSARFAARLRSYRQLNVERDETLAQLEELHEDLKDKYDMKVKELNEELNERKQLAMATELWYVGSVPFPERLKVYAYDLADSVQFQDRFFTEAQEGGADAAYQLHSEIQSQLRLTYPDDNVSDWSIIAQVFLNGPSLAARLHLCGITKSYHDLQTFARSFGHAQALFSFVDVGYGKERADHKIRETLRLYMPNLQCRHVFLGPCHDNGYLPNLEPYKRNPALASRLTLIETTPAETGFVKLGLKRIRLDSVFRSEPLPSKSGPAISGAAQLFLPPSRPVRGTTPPSNRLEILTPPEHSVALARQDSKDTTEPQKPPYSNVTTSSTSAAAAATTSTTTTTTTKSPNTWATVGKKGIVRSTTPTTFNITPKKAPPFALLNKDDERLDAELPRYDPGAKQRVNDRMHREGRHLCNFFHLSNACDAGRFCDYSHGERLAGPELLVLRHKVRGIVCSYGAGCRDVHCMCGHVCKSGGGENCFYGQECLFHYTHRMDVQPAKRLYEDGSEEWLPNYLNKLGKK